MPRAFYTDQEVMAAFNSCLDLEKYKALPDVIKNRIPALFRAHRVKPVCFMEDCGLGLRVYIDALSVVYDDDEVSIDGEFVGTSSADKGQVDTDGAWLRCPPSLYVEKQEWIVLNEYGRSVIQIVEPDEDQDDPTGLELPSDPKKRRYLWKSRHCATVFPTREEADQVAKLIHGVVVKL